MGPSGEDTCTRPTSIQVLVAGVEGGRYVDNPGGIRHGPKRRLIPWKIYGGTCGQQALCFLCVRSSGPGDVLAKVMNDIEPDSLRPLRKSFAPPAFAYLGHVLV